MKPILPEKIQFCGDVQAWCVFQCRWHGESTNWCRMTFVYGPPKTWKTEAEARAAHPYAK